MRKKSLIYGPFPVHTKFTITDSTLPGFRLDSDSTRMSTETATTRRFVPTSVKRSVASIDIPSQQEIPNMIDTPKTIKNTPNIEEIGVKLETLYTPQGNQGAHRRIYSDIPNFSIKDIENTYSKRSTIHNISEIKGFHKPKPSLPALILPSVSSPKIEPTALTVNPEEQKINNYLKYLEMTEVHKDLRASIEQRLRIKPKPKQIIESIPQSYSLVKLPTRKQSDDSLDKTSSPKSTKRSKVDKIFEERDKKLAMILKRDPRKSPKKVRKNQTNRETKSPHRREAVSKVFEWYNKYEETFVEMSYHLKKLFDVIKNEAKFEAALRRLCNNSQDILIHLLPKSTKILEMDPDKLIKRFCMMEIIAETLPIPALLDKKRLGIIIIEPSTMERFLDFNERLSQQMIKMKHDELIHLEEDIISSEQKLSEHKAMKLRNLKKTGKLADYRSAERIFNNKPRIDPFIFNAYDAVKAVASYESNHQELKYVKRKNVEHARALNEVFDDWIKYIAENVEN